MEGRIIQIDQTGFRFAPDRGEIRNGRRSDPFDIAFDEVRAIKSTMTPAKRVQVVAVVAAGVGVVLAMVLRPVFEQ